MSDNIGKIKDLSEIKSVFTLPSFKVFNPQFDVLFVILLFNVVSFYGFMIQLICVRNILSGSRYLGSMTNLSTPGAQRCLIGIL